jgi:hypothetical protein
MTRTNNGELERPGSKWEATDVRRSSMTGSGGGGGGVVAATNNANEATIIATRDFTTSVKATV